MTMDDRLPYAQRFAQGKVIHAFPNQLDVELVPPLPGLAQVRIQREHWSPADQHWATGDPVASLFIYDFNKGGTDTGGHSFASMRWGRPANNPWDTGHPDHPVAGQHIEGHVYARAGEQNVMVRFGEHLLEGFLNLRQVPHGYNTTTDKLLPLGMRVRAVITQVDRGRCAVELSVVQQLQTLESQRGRGPHLLGMEHPATPYVRYLGADASAPTPAIAETTEALVAGRVSARWQGKRVLLIDNDKAYALAAEAWFVQFGAGFVFADNAVFAKAQLNHPTAPPTHVLVDYHLGSSSEVLALVRALGAHRKSMHVAIASGAPGADVLEGVKKLREKLHAPQLALFAKPLHFDSIDSWLLQGTQPADPKMPEPAALWDHTDGEVNPDLAQRAGQWLQTLVQATNTLGALWVKCHAPGHDIGATAGLLTDLTAEDRATTLARLAHELPHSVVADVEGNQQAYSVKRASSAGPLGRVFPAGASHCLAVPLGTTHMQQANPAKVTDVLLFFSRAAFTAKDLIALERWPALLRWWYDLQELGRLQDRLREDAVFATQGRVHMATLHELRPALQVFQHQKKWSAEEAVSWWDKGKKISALVDGGLYTIRAGRVQEVSLRERLYALTDQYLWLWAQRRFVTLVVHLPPEGLRVTLAPEVFEQTLINLVDNATKACATRRWAQVHVRVAVDATKTQTPLVVTVADDGVGMTPQEVRHLYQPRHSQLGTGGFGMGLFISKRLAQAAGGDLVLTHNVRWAGCSFELRLPLTMGTVAPAAPRGRQA
jgi:signal transduction histidine kinase